MIELVRDIGWVWMISMWFASITMGSAAWYGVTPVVIGFIAMGCVCLVKAVFYGRP